MLKMISIRAALAIAAFCPLASHAVEAVPFKANMQTKESVGLNPGVCKSAPFLQGSTEGTGIASFLGRVTGTAKDCITPGEGSYTFTGGHMVLTASNGETLTADYSGSLTPTGVESVFTLSGSYRITGGTGRFARATGFGSMQGTNNIVSGVGSYTLTGQINY